MIRINRIVADPNPPYHRYKNVTECDIPPTIDINPFVYDPSAININCDFQSNTNNIYPHHTENGPYHYKLIHILVHEKHTEKSGHYLNCIIGNQIVVLVDNDSVQCQNESYINRIQCRGNNFTQFSPTAVGCLYMQTQAPSVNANAENKEIEMHDEIDQPSDSDSDSNCGLDISEGSSSDSDNECVVTEPAINKSVDEFSIDESSINPAIKHLYAYDLDCRIGAQTMGRCSHVIMGLVWLRAKLLRQQIPDPHPISTKRGSYITDINKHGILKLETTSIGKYWD